MADLTSITAVNPLVGTTSIQVTYGATIAIGETLYLDTTDSKYKLAQATTSTLAEARAIAITAGVDGDQGIVAVAGSILLVGTTMAIGESYVVSATAGAIAPETDLATTNYVTRLGTAATATQLDLDFNSTGIQHA